MLTLGTAEPSNETLPSTESRSKEPAMTAAPLLSSTYSFKLALRLLSKPAWARETYTMQIIAEEHKNNAKITRAIQKPSLTPKKVAVQMEQAIMLIIASIRLCPAWLTCRFESGRSRIGGIFGVILTQTGTGP
jgi:hypothetical protein